MAAHPDSHLIYVQYSGRARTFSYPAERMEALVHCGHCGQDTDATAEPDGTNAQCVKGHELPDLTRERP